MVIRHVGVWSVSRLYGAISASFGLLIGACFAFFAVIGGMARGFGADFGARSGGLGMILGVGAVIFLPIFYGIIGIVAGAVGAALYNLYAGMLGGVEIETSPESSF